MHADADDPDQTEEDEPQRQQVGCRFREHQAGIVEGDPRVEFAGAAMT